MINILLKIAQNVNGDDAVVVSRWKLRKIREIYRNDPEGSDKAAGVTPRDTETHVSDSWARGNGDLKNEFTNLKCKFNTRFLRTHADEKALIRNFSKYYASIKLDNTTKKIFDIIDEKPNLKEKNWGFIIEL